MADLNSNLQQLVFGQADKETTVNELFGAASPSMLFGRDGVTSQGLNFGIIGGRLNGALVANQVLTLANNSTLYLTADAVTGAVTAGAAWGVGIKTYKVTTLGGFVTSYEDHRMAGSGNNSLVMANISDKQGKVVDDPIIILDYVAEIDALMTPGVYLVETSGINSYFSGAMIFVVESAGVVYQNALVPSFGKYGTRYHDGIGWSNWSYSIGTVEVDTWYATTTAAAADAVINANGTFSRSVSSEEWKREIEAMQDSYADAIVQGAAPIYYRSKCERDPDDWSYWGISAEQLAEIDPRLVHWGHSTKEVPQPFGQPPKTAPDLDSPLKPVGVQYSRLVVPLLQVVKRQGAAIAALEARLAFLEMLHSP